MCASIMDSYVTFNLFINSVKFGSPDEFYRYYKDEYLEKQIKECPDENIKSEDTHVVDPNLGSINKLLKDLSEYMSRVSRPIHVACEFENVEIVKILIELKCDVNMNAKDGMRPIHLACKAGNVEIVKLLIAAGCNFDFTTFGDFPINFACESGNAELVKLLADLNFSLNTSCNIFLEIFPLHIACQFGHVELVKYLIDQKCDIEIKSESKLRPIHFACECNSVEIVKILTDLNCNILAKDENKRTPLDIARKQENQEIINILKRAMRRGNVLKLLTS